jgi:hypothetical protein
MHPIHEEGQQRMVFLPAGTGSSRRPRDTLCDVWEQALAFEACVHGLIRDHGRQRERAEEAIALSEKHGYDLVGGGFKRRRPHHPGPGALAA